MPAHGNVADLADPNVVKVVVDHEGFALYFSRAAIPYHGRNLGIRFSLAPTNTWASMSTDVTSCLKLAALKPTPLERSERLEQLRALEHGYRIRTVEITRDPIGVDTPEDLDRVRQIISAGAPA